MALPEPRQRLLDYENGGPSKERTLPCLAASLFIAAARVEQCPKVWAKLWLEHLTTIVNESLNERFALCFFAGLGGLGEMVVWRRASDILPRGSSSRCLG
jgi:hypothetical protein